MRQTSTYCMLVYSPQNRDYQKALVMWFCTSGFHKSWSELVLVLIMFTYQGRYNGVRYSCKCFVSWWFPQTLSHHKCSLTASGSNRWELVFQIGSPSLLQFSISFSSIPWKLELCVKNPRADKRLLFKLVACCPCHDHMALFWLAEQFHKKTQSPCTKIRSLDNRYDQPCSCYVLS